MKKTTMTAIVTALTAIDSEKYSDLIAEVNAELNKGAEQKQKNAEAYESIHDLIVENLGDTPCTCAELYEVIKDELPTGMGKGEYLSARLIYHCPDTGVTVTVDIKPDSRV